MELNIKPYQLEFRHPFGVSSNTRKHTDTVFISLTHQEYCGYGEACLPPYLGEDVANTIQFLESLRPFLVGIDPTTEPVALLDHFDSLPGANNAAKAALNIALNDLKGKILQKPYYEMCGAGKSEPKPTSFTIGIDAESKLENKLIEASDFSVLKIKAGTADDRRLIMQIRKYTNRQLYVDVNQGWKDDHHALKLINWMKDQGVLFVEQPMPVKMMDEMKWLYERSSIDLFADESVKRYDDLVAVGSFFSGINIKLMKCAGLDEALRMIEWCKTNSKRVMLGCMAESSCGVSAMTQLMNYADFIDLDGPLLYKNDPFVGVKYEKGKVVLNDLPGIGVVPKAGLF